MIKQLTKDQAIAMHDSGAWDEMTMRERAVFQLNQEKLCMPFSAFHEAVEKTLGRPVFTHEFAFGGAARMLKEITGEAAPPTFEEILNTIPADKRVLIIQIEPEPDGDAAEFYDAEG